VAHGGQEFGLQAIEFQQPLVGEREFLRAGGDASLELFVGDAQRVLSGPPARNIAQEADESALWLELLAEDCGVTTASLSQLLRETHELLAIFDDMQ